MARIHVSQSRADEHIRARRQRYQRDCDKVLRVTSMLTIGDMVLVDRPPVSVVAAHSTNVMAMTMYSKLLSRALGLISLMSLQPRTLTIDEDGILERAQLVKQHGRPQEVADTPHQVTSK